VQRLATLTVNPAIDSSCEAEAVSPTRKIRTFGERYDPGGGGLNVARVLHRFGAAVDAVYLSGGPTGALLDELLDGIGLPRRTIPIRDHTRMSLAVYERATGHEYRFVPEGPLIAADEGAAARAAVLDGGYDWVIASGSLPRGLSDAFFASLADPLRAKGARLVVDTSGAALRAALAAGGLFLVKPSVGEFEAWLGRSLTGHAEVAEAAQRCVAEGMAAHVAVTMGEEGAVLAHPGGVLIHPGIKAVARSTTGAGDSFLAGIIDGFLRGEPLETAFHRGIAAGTAAVLNPGTDLCQIADVERLLTQIQAS
jgi:6-phosphofructokinase 2